MKGGVLVFEHAVNEGITWHIYNDFQYLKQLKKKKKMKINRLL